MREQVAVAGLIKQIDSRHVSCIFHLFLLSECPIVSRDHGIKAEKKKGWLHFQYKIRLYRVMLNAYHDNEIKNKTRNLH